MNFREQIESLKNESDSDFEAAWAAANQRVYAKYANRGILLTDYHLWENGYEQGPASDEAMQNDAIALGIDVTVEDWYDALIEKLKTDFIEFFGEEVA